MSKYRQQLPITNGQPFITDAGLETELVFREGYDLPEFAAFPLLKDPAAIAKIEHYYRHYIDIARKQDTGLILEAPTWRASLEWGKKLDCDEQELAWFNQQAIKLLDGLRSAAGLTQPCVISGCIGPRYDGYDPEHYMTATEAEAYHRQQITTFSQSEADLVTALTMTSIAEALGVAKAAKAVDMPVVISFTTETDGKLPSGESLADAIAELDQATDHYPVYYMINCAHPTHFQSVLEGDQAWAKRIGGVRANASCKSHAELDESTELDSGNPTELGQQYRILKDQHLTNLHVIGGCCGTNHEHIHAMAQACFG